MKNKFLVIIICAVVIIGAGYFFVTSTKIVSTPQETVTLRLGYTAVPAHAMFIAQEKGFFNEVGINAEFQKFSNANLVMEALSRGDLDGAGALAYSTLFAFENASPNKFKIYQGFAEERNNGWSALIVKKNSGITSPKDLKGKKIVMRSGLSSKSQGELVIKGMGLSMNDVEFVQVEASLLVPTFAKTEISAFLDVQPFATMIVQRGLGDVLIASPRAEYIQNPYPGAAAVLGKDFVDNNPEVVKRFISAINKSVDFIHNNDTETRKIFQQYLELEENIAMNMPLAKIEKLSEIDRGAVERLADFDVASTVLDKKPNISGLFLAN